MIIRIRVNIIMTFSRFGSFINNDTFIIMTSVLNIEPDHLIIRSIIKEDIRYDFLKFLKDKYNIKDIHYYNLLNSLDTFKLKNIYRYLYLRTYKISGKINCKMIPLKKKEGKISGEELNEYLNKYINPTGTEPILIHSIIIMNGIQLYLFPQIN